MQATLVEDSAVLELATFDAIDLSLDGHVHPNWAFLDEVLSAAARHGWRLRDAVWAVLATRARRAGRRGDVDVDALVLALEPFMPASLRLGAARGPASA